MNFPLKSAVLVLLLQSTQAGLDFVWQSDCSDNIDFCGEMVYCKIELYGADLRGYRWANGICESPGPNIHIQGDKVYQLVLTNDVEGEDTNLHTHGLHIDGSGPQNTNSGDLVKSPDGTVEFGTSDDVTRHVAYGCSITYEWHISDDGMPGTNWYHAHLHGDTKDQVSKGAFGLLIKDASVGYFPEGLPQLDALFANERTAIISASTTPTWTLQTDEWYLGRILVVDIKGHGQTLSVGEGCTVYELGNDGILYFKLPDTQETSATEVIVASGASRADIAIKCTQDAALGDIEISVVPVDSTLTPGAGLVAWSTTRPAHLQDLRDLAVDNTYSIELGFNTPGVGAVNGMSWDPNVPLLDIEFGTVQQWNITSDSHTHPFHLHLYHMQVVSENCGSLRVGEYYDTISGVEPMGTCTVRFRTINVAGRCVLHCHNLGHEDSGMMGWVNVQNGPPRIAAADQCH